MFLRRLQFALAGINFCQQNRLVMFAEAIKFHVTIFTIRKLGRFNLASPAEECGKPFPNNYFGLSLRRRIAFFAFRTTHKLKRG